MKRSRFSEEQIVYAIRQAESGTPIGDVCAGNWHRRANLLRLEKEVRASRRERTPPAAPGGRGERPAQTAGGRSLARQAHAVGGAPKKSLRPARRRELAHWFQDTFR
jgi:hypothetical protein